MDTNCGLFAADVFINYEIYSMLFLSRNNRDDVIEAFKSTSRYLNNLFPQNALRRDCNGNSIECNNGHYLEVTVDV